MTNKLQIGLLLIVLSFATLQIFAQEQMDLSGTWQIRLDPNDIGEKSGWYSDVFDDRIQLPGTTAEGGYGDTPSHDFLKECVRDLNPRYGGPVPNLSYEGSAWYQKTIYVPLGWENKRVTLFMERARWKSDVWVNGTYMGGDNSLSTPHEIDLSGAIKHGNNKISIRIDNRMMFYLGPISSGTSYHTQGMWNGIIGRIELIKNDPVNFEDVQVFPDVDNKQAVVKADIINTTEHELKVAVNLRVTSPEGKEVAQLSKELLVKKGNSKVKFNLELGNKLWLWDEFTPDRYSLEAQLESALYNDKALLKFGMRKLEQDGTNILVNGKKVVMRGTLECANFPLTAYPAMTEGYWLHIMGIMKSHGLNHVRFHSWTPPAAAFEAADRLGLYLLTEATRANSQYTEERELWIENEMLRIQKCYANHPSFALFSSGNELQNTLYETGETLLKKMKAADNRHLHTFCSGGQGMDMVEGNIEMDDFLVYGVRGNAICEGRLYRNEAHTYHDNIITPTTDYDLDNRLDKKVPVISHEIGQWCVYPSMAEIEKYTGVMQPDNLTLVREDLKTKGLLEQASDFTRVTAKAAEVLYKEEIETVLRSKKTGGFQLLQLNDYSGQGTAHCGLYDAFWDVKEDINLDDFKQYSGAVVPLLRLPKFIWSNNETFTATAEIRNNGTGHLSDVIPFWKVVNSLGETVAEGEWNKGTIEQGEIMSVGNIQFKLNKIKEAQQLTVQVGVSNNEILNQWDIWVYPTKVDFQKSNDIVISTMLDNKTLDALEKGKKVLLLPTFEDLDKAIKGRFLAPFWSPVHWWTRPHRGNVSMSILCDPKHPALAHFPTDEFSDWQWCELLDRSSSFILDDLPRDLKPIVQVVDNFSRNHKLANIIEARVGKGSLLLCGLDLENFWETKPEFKQMRWSLLKYMNSPDFTPEENLTVKQIQSLFK